MNNIKIKGSYTCPICKESSNISLASTHELQLIEENCPHCAVELEMSVWVRNNVPVMFCVKPHNLVFEWIQNSNGDLILYRHGKPIEASIIPEVMLNYSDISNGEEVKVNIDGLKKYIEKAVTLGI
jgi:Zn ribbon nucleic-acid-binding protein